MGPCRDKSIGDNRLWEAVKTYFTRYFPAGLLLVAVATAIVVINSVLAVVLWIVYAVWLWSSKEPVFPLLPVVCTVWVAYEFWRWRSRIDEPHAAREPRTLQHRKLCTKEGTHLGESMDQSIDTDQKQQLAAWNKRCATLWLKYFAIVLLPLFILMFPFFQVLSYFLDVTRPLVTGELVYGQPGYYEFQAARDQSLMILAGLLVLAAAHYYLCNRWYKKALRTLRPPPGDSSRWNRWVFGKAQDS